MHEAKANLPSKPIASQHADAYLLDAERAARQAHHGENARTVPACNVSPAGLRLVAVIDVPIGTRLANVRNQPVTLIGASESHAMVRFDDGQIEAVELSELTTAFMANDDAFNDRLAIQALDTLGHLGHLGHLLAELQTLDPEDGIDAQTVADAKAMRERLGQRVETLCGEAFTAASRA